MTITALPALDSVLSQMQNVASVAANTTSVLNPALKTAPTSFAQELQHSLSRLAQTQNNATQQANEFIAGTGTASLSDVMIDTQKASLAFQTTVQVRNKLIEAYQTIASMPV